MFLQDAVGRNIELAPEIVAAFQTVVDTLLENRPSVLYPKRALLTTQQAADYLGVSRPYLIKLLEEGKLPFSTTGTHRRILFEQLADYQASLDKLRDEALEEMVRIGEEGGMYELRGHTVAEDSAP
ncbi:MAG: helix-turn-helix domain-containing protein [Thermomicrobiales bacterium]|nr:helix-turn-helix domain-containing protein [Thermomicrobiales bacterium]